MHTLGSAYAKKAAIAGLRLYQGYVSPYLPPRCRFYPTCSEYAVQCLQQDPGFRALRKIFVRLFSCNPFHPGGVDLP